MPSLPVKVGVEIEFIGPPPLILSHVLTKRYRIPCSSRDGQGYDRDRWTFGGDSSVFESYPAGDDLDDNNAVEMRSPILHPNRLQVLRKILGILEPMTVVTRSCGMHVHVSSDQREAFIDAVPLAKDLDSRYRKEVWRGRGRYCLKGAALAGEKYRTVNVVNGNHIEVRVFNSSLDFGVVHSRIRSVVDLYRKHLRYQDVNGYGRPISSKKKVEESIIPDHEEEIVVPVISPVVVPRRRRSSRSLSYVLDW